MILSIGCDHIVTPIKNELIEYLCVKGYRIIDNGTYDTERTHYPIFGRRTAAVVACGKADFGIVLCGTGVGITNAANKVRGARACLARDVETARMARRELNANVLGIGGLVTGINLIKSIADVFLSEPYTPTPEREARIHAIDALVPKEQDDQSTHYFDEFLLRWERGEYVD